MSLIQPEQIQRERQDLIQLEREKASIYLRMAAQDPEIRQIRGKIQDGVNGYCAMGAILYKKFVCHEHRKLTANPDQIADFLRRVCPTLKNYDIVTMNDKFNWSFDKIVHSLEQNGY